MGLLRIESSPEISLPPCILDSDQAQINSVQNDTRLVSLWIFLNIYNFSILGSLSNNSAV